MQCLCTTTQQWYTPLRCEVAATIAGITFVWAYCPLCDTYRRTQTDAGYTPDRPQPHIQRLDQCRASDQEHAL